MKIPQQNKVVRAGLIIEVFRSLKYPVRLSKSSGRRSSKPVRRADASLRAKRMMRWLSSANGEPGTTYFFTATFADDVQDYDVALSRWVIFRRLLLRAYPACRYVAVPELQARSGRWHFHAVLCGLPLLDSLRSLHGSMVTKSGSVCDRWQYSFTEMWSKANGGLKVHRANIEVANSVGGVCGYLVKYLAKDIGGVVPAGRRNYYAGGKGLKRPHISIESDFVEPSSPSFLSEYQDKFGNPVSFARYVT